MAQIIPISIQWKRSKKMNARWTSLIRQGREWYEESNTLSVSLKEGTQIADTLYVFLNRMPKVLEDEII